MKNATLDHIKNTVLLILKQKYGYCGLAEGDNFAMLNSGGDGENLIIEIKDDSVVNTVTPP
jgi:hypothetical protein